MQKLSEIELLKYWLDAEVTILHAMFAFVLVQLTHSTWQHIILYLYIAFSVVYSTVRIAVVAQQDRNYLRVPKRK